MRTAESLARKSLHQLNQAVDLIVAQPSLVTQLFLDRPAKVDDQLDLLCAIPAILVALITVRMQKLFTDQELYDRLLKTVTELNAVLTDVRRDPRRYTKGLITVF